MSISERFSTICGNYPVWYWIEFPRLQQSLKNVCEEDVRRRDFYLRQEMLCLSMGPILKAENWNPIGREERKWTFCMDNYVCLRDGGVERHLWWSDKSDGVIEPRLGGGGGSQMARVRPPETMRSVAKSCQHPSKHGPNKLGLSFRSILSSFCLCLVLCSELHPSFHPSILLFLFLL